MDPEGRRRLAARAAVVGGAFFVLLIIFSCRELPREEDVPLAAFPGRIAKAPTVRLVVRRRATSVGLAINGPYTIYDGRGREVYNRRSRRLSHVHVTFNGRHLSLGAVPAVVKGESLPRIRIRPQELGSLTIDGLVYPGDVEFAGVRGTRTLHCVVHLNIEEYICGVLAGEVPVDKWHDEALKAQAVTSRTYAMFYHLRNRGKLWDYGTKGVEAQQYKPGIVRNARVNRAVNLTSGQLLTWKNQVFPAYFHSSCGGHTLDSAKVFTRQSIEPLAGVECKWCTALKGNKYRTWKTSYTAATIAGRLERAARTNPRLRALRNKGGVRGLEVAESTPDGRITQFLVRVRYSPGSFAFWANDVRAAIGFNDLRSTKCKMTATRYRYRFEGSGWGHGVGLCQWGAQGMAIAGHDYQDVLGHYFPYSRLVRMTYDQPEEAPTVAVPRGSPPAGSRSTPPPAPSRSGSGRPKG